MKSLFTLLIVALVLGCQQTAPNPAPALASTSKPLHDDEHANPPFNSVGQMMRAKLAHAQAILEGVATHHMDQVEQNANALIRLSEMVEWQVHRTMEYKMYSDDFQWNAKELSRHAREQKLHAATLDYMQLTMTCVRCHDYMGQAGLVQLDLRGPTAASLK